MKVIYDANEKYHAIVQKHAATITTEAADREWYMSSYVDAYYALDTAIKSYMSSPKSSLAVRMSKIEHNIYKTITPSILTLIIAIVIVCMFYFFIDTYYTRPVQRISKALGYHLQSKLPYKVKVDDKGEIAELNENIISLIALVGIQNDAVGSFVSRQSAIIFGCVITLFDLTIRIGRNAAKQRTQLVGSKT